TTQATGTKPVRVLHVRLKSGLTGVTDVIVVGTQPLDVSAPLTIQPISLADALRQRGRIAVQPVPPLETALEEGSGLVALPSDALADWLTGTDAALVSQAYRWEMRPAALTLRVWRNRPQVRCETVVGLYLDADICRHVARLRYDISRAGQDRFA